MNKNRFVGYSNIIYLYANKTEKLSHTYLKKGLPVWILACFSQTWAYLIRGIYYLSLQILPGCFGINLHSPCSLLPAAAIHTEHFHNSDRKGHKINLNVFSWAIKELDMVIRPSLMGLSLSALISEMDTFMYWSNPLKSNRVIQLVRVSLVVTMSPPAMNRRQKTCLTKAPAG